MFGELLAGYVEWSAAALDDCELRRLELEAQVVDARRLAVRAAAELKQTPGAGRAPVDAGVSAGDDQPARGEWCWARSVPRPSV